MQVSVSIGASARPLVKRPSAAKYKTVLSIDGGGIRGIVPTMVLKKLEEAIKQHIHDNRDTLVPAETRHHFGSVEDFDVDLTDYFDLVAGTSIGSCIAGYIAARGRGAESITNDKNLTKKYGTLRPGSMEPIRVMFREYSRRVFPRRSIISNLTRFSRSAYPSDGLLSLLEDAFGETTMKDLDTGCLITSYDLGRHTACSFLRGPGPTGETYLVRTAARDHPRESASDGANHARTSGRVVHLENGDWDPDLDVTAGVNFRLFFQWVDFTSASVKDITALDKI